MSLEKTEKKIEIDDLGLSLRTSRILIKEFKFVYLHQLQEFTGKHLLAHYGFGKRSLLEIRKMMARHGMALKDEPLDLEIRKSLLIDLPILLEEVRDLKEKLRIFIRKIESW